MAQAKRDENRVTTLLAVSSVDGVTPVVVYADPTTHRLLTDLGSAGTVTSVSVVSANGFAGTVATATTTPAITLTTTITGVLKGNGTAISAATDGTDYLSSTTGLKLDQTSAQTISNDTPIFNTLTASELVATTAAKKLQSLAVATYPSLTEISYVKGVTSAIQTQLNAKQGTTISALSVWVANSANTITEVTPGAGNSIRINGAGNAWEAYTPSASVPTTITVANEATDATCFIGFFTAATGDLGPKTNANLTFDSSTGVLTAGQTIVGSISGNAGTASAVAVGGITGLGTSVATALAVNVGTAGAFVVNGGALGTPSSGTVTNLTGTASININGTVGATTPTTATFTTATINTNLVPDANDGAGLGLAATAFSDLFLASGALIGFDNGNAVITHSSGILTVSTGDLRVTTAGTNAASVVTLDGTQTLGNKTLTAPKFANAGYIADANGNELAIFTTTASAVNEITIANGATGNNPKITASGGDANVGLDFQSKATGTYRFLGNSTQAAELRLYEDTDNGTNYTAFKVGAQAGDITYTLPTDDGDSGQVLSTDGAGVLDWITAGGSNIPTGLNWFTIFESSSRFSTSVAGTGAAAGVANADTQGLSLTTGSQTTGTAIVNTRPFNTFGVRGGSSAVKTTVSMTLEISTILTNHKGYFGAGDDNAPISSGAYNWATTRHIGFKINGSGSGTGTVVGTIGNTTAESDTATLTTIANGDILTLVIEITWSGTATFYYSKNGAAMSAGTSLTSNFPTSNAIRWLVWGVGNGASETSGYTVNVFDTELRGG